MRLAPSGRAYAAACKVARSPLGREGRERVDGIPDIDESRRQRGEPDSDQIRATKVDDHVALDQRGTQLARVGVGHGHMCSASEPVARRGDGESALPEAGGYEGDR